MISIFDLFKVGIGPSSSHTVGPMRAAKRFAEELQTQGQLSRTDQLVVGLYGSLALTGKGHGTDRAILLGLSGEAPDQIEPDTIEMKVAAIQEQRNLRVLGTHLINFDPEEDLEFHPGEVLPTHPNGMRFTAYDWEGQQLHTNIFYSIGGGFIITDHEQSSGPAQLVADVPYPFKSGTDLLRLGGEHQKAIWEMVLKNEEIMLSEQQIQEGIRRIWNIMKDCTYRGLRTEGYFGWRAQRPSAGAAVIPSTFYLSQLRPTRRHGLDQSVRDCGQ